MICLKASDSGETVAIIYRSGVRRTSYSYEEIYTMARRMASLLAAEGVGPGDRALIWGPGVFAFWGVNARGGMGALRG